MGEAGTEGGHATAEPGYEALERALIDVLRRTLVRSLSLAREGRRVDKAGYHLLTRLEDSGDVRLSDLSAVMELDLSTVSRQVRQLEDAGLVQRRADPDDGRAALVDLTQDGIEELQTVRRARHRQLAEAMAGWAPRDRDDLARLLRRLADDLAAAPTPRVGSKEAVSRTRPEGATASLQGAGTR